MIKIQKIYNPYTDLILEKKIEDRKSSDYRYGDGIMCERYINSEKVPASYKQIQGNRYSLRYHWVKRYSWAIPDLESLAMIQKHSPYGVVEIGAGTGYWAYMLSQMEVDVVAFDSKPLSNKIVQGKRVDGSSLANRYCEANWFTVVTAGPSIVKRFPNRTLFICWPPYQERLAYDALRFYRGNTFVYVGERMGGCCGDDRFFNRLHREWKQIDSCNLIQWEYLHDGMTVWRRR